MTSTVVDVAPVTREIRLLKELLAYVALRSFVKSAVSPVSTLNVPKLKYKLCVGFPGPLTYPWLAGMVYVPPTRGTIVAGPGVWPVSV